MSKSGVLWVVEARRERSAGWKAIYPYETRSEARSSRVRRYWKFTRVVKYVRTEG